MHIEYEIEFVNPTYQKLYGRMNGALTGPNLKEPYAAVRKSLGHWIKDQKEAAGLPSGGAVPKFRFLHLVVDGKQLAGISKSNERVWCLHCERVGPVRLDVDGDKECSYCGAGLADLWQWKGAYEAGRVYEHYSPEQLVGVGMSGRK